MLIVLVSFVESSKDSSGANKIVETFIITIIINPEK